jgi:hypothetical protein
VGRKRLVIAAILKNIDFSKKKTVIWKCKLGLPLYIVISFKHCRNDRGLARQLHIGYLFSINLKLM